MHWRRLLKLCHAMAANLLLIRLIMTMLVPMMMILNMGAPLAQESFSFQPRSFSFFLVVFEHHGLL
jgi:hypothetical protein